MNTKNIVIGVMVVAIILLGGLYLSSNRAVGAPSGQAHYQVESFLEGLTAGGRDQFSISRLGVLTSSAVANLTGRTNVKLLTSGGQTQATTTLATTATLAASDILEHSGMVMKPQSGSIALTLPASSTLATFAPNVGDVRTFTFQNSTTTAGILMTFTGGTGNTLKRFATSSVYEIVSDTDDGALAVFTVVRAANLNGVAGDLIWNIQKNAD